MALDIPVMTPEQLVEWVKGTGLKKQQVAHDILGIESQTLWTWMSGRNRMSPHAMRTIRFYEEARALKRLDGVYGLLGLNPDPDKLP